MGTSEARSSVLRGLGRRARLGQLRLKGGPRGGAVVVVGEGESPLHGEAPQSLPPSTRGSREGLRCRSASIHTQRNLATKAWKRQRLGTTDVGNDGKRSDG